ncbi:MAG: metallophosphoesterase [Deltaproteobacteria bacterium]|nr:metallophosphoesterase [Deltaproteobacteria bacterium]
MAVVKVLHVSDVHLEDGFPGVPLKSFMNKRIVGLANLRFRRRRVFAEAVQKVEALAAFSKEQGADLVICTGDYTALGTEPEIAYARKIIEPLTHAPLGFFTVPGNHDLYLRDTVEAGWFDQHFGALMKTANPKPTYSSGRIPDEQLDALARILDDARVRDRFVMIATHYAPRLANGRPDRPAHGLENADDLLAISAAARRGVIIHGHIHWRYHVRVPETPLTLCCAGSTTHAGREGLWMYEVGDDRVTATPGTWDQTRYVLEADQAIRIDP